jgi:predicted dehydrogenase
MSKQPIRAAVIGLGRIGSSFDDEIGAFQSFATIPHAHAACYQAAEELALVAGADALAGQREAFIKKWGFNRNHVYADYRDMLERERPEIVSICTATNLRASILIEVAQANAGVRAIWAEKPIASSLEEADRMIDACGQAGILVAFGSSRCWDVVYNRIRELVDLGEIGQPLQVNGYGSCRLSHNGSHLLTLVRYMAGGNCQWVFGAMERDEEASRDDDLAGNGYLQFDSGVQAFVRTMACGPAEWEFDVIGTEGRLRAINDGEEVEFWKVGTPTLPGRRREPIRQIFPRPRVKESANLRTLKDLIACLETGKQPNCDGHGGRQALEIAIALRESHRRGGVRVDLPLADRSLRINSWETLLGDEPAIIRKRRAAKSLDR